MSYFFTNIYIYFFVKMYLKVVDDLLAMLRPSLACTTGTRVAALRALGLLALPYVGADEKRPFVDRAAERNNTRRAVVKCAKVRPSQDSSHG